MARMTMCALAVEPALQHSWLRGSRHRGAPPPLRHWAVGFGGRHLGDLRAPLGLQLVV